MIKQLNRFFLLPFAEKWLFGRSFVLIVLVRLGLWFLPFILIDRWLEGAVPGPDNEIDWQTVRRIVRSVRTCSRYVPYATCLTQALVTRVLLGVDGQPADLKIGVKKEQDEEFAAHAWLEVEGRIVIGKVPHHGQFAVLR